uniref:Uncharacterized protein n=1 Tax=Meloidogyne enterolobii TaxID=390850 RepID=A0A6V7V796_MELEN|nr:unnamed protein product [Meloidogyne enterolobii]
MFQYLLRNPPEIDQENYYKPNAQQYEGSAQSFQIHHETNHEGINLFTLLTIYHFPIEFQLFL